METSGWTNPGGRFEMSNATRREWTVSGMDCAACTVKVTRAVEHLPGVSEVKVALMSERLSLTLAPQTTDPGQIEAIVKRLGFDIAPRTGGGPAASAAPAMSMTTPRTGASAGIRRPRASW
jgi:Cd2+/Zn2+-exporting ATPase